MVELPGGGTLGWGLRCRYPHFCYPRALRTVTPRLQGGILPAQVLATPLSKAHVPMVLTQPKTRGYKYMYSYREHPAARGTQPLHPGSCKSPLVTHSDL